MDRDKQIIKVSIFGIIVNLVLVTFKAIVGLIANSIAIILDAVNNLSDIVSALITIIGTKLSRKKPDKEHPYGHGRMEYFAAVIISIIIIVAGITAFKESIKKIIAPEASNYSIVSLIIIMVAVLVKFFFGRYVKNKGEKLNSGSLKATGIDAISDSFLSLSTFVGALISMIWHISLEGYLGVLISLFILKSGIEILKDTKDQMIGVRADSKTTQDLRNKILAYEGVLGVYDLMLHNYGANSIIGTAHIQVRDDMNAKEIHRLTKRISIEIYQELGIVLTLGIYASNDSEEYIEIKKYIDDLAGEYKNVKQIHGFYVDEEIKNVSFDIIFDFDELEQEKIVEEIKAKLKQKFPEYNYFIIIDTDVSD